MKIKQEHKLLLISMAALVAVFVTPFVILGTVGIVMVVYFVHYLGSQMEAGRIYMDSLNEKNIEAFTQRSEKLLASHTTYTSIDDEFLPEDLTALKIIRVDVLPPETVYFVWAGGLDHTYLEVHKQSNGDYRVTAYYQDEEPSRQLWPKDTGRPVAP